MKVLVVLGLCGLLMLASCEGEVDIEDAGEMPPEAKEPAPPGIDDSGDQTGNDKRDGGNAGNSGTAVRNVHKIQEERRSQNSDGSDGGEADMEKRKGERRRGKDGRRTKQKQKLKPELKPELISSGGSAVKNMNEAKALEISGVETPCRASDQEIRDTVAIHQKYRTQEHGSNIWAIEWDDSLARLGQGLADTCVFKHTNLNFSNKTRVGQNLAILKGNDHTIETVTRLFFQEKVNYNMNDHSWDDFSLVGHYLQLIWWDTVKVGCGITFCPQLYLPEDDLVWNNAWYWACDYWPPLHTDNRPYESGVPCTQCVVPEGKGIGWKCVQNTCEECDATENGCNSAGPCTDFAPDIKPAKTCSKILKFGYCEKGTPGYSFAKYYCTTTCRFCRGIPESIALKR